MFKDKLYYGILERLYGAIKCLKIDIVIFDKLVYNMTKGLSLGKVNNPFKQYNELLIYVSIIS